MLDIKKHRIVLLQILKDIYSNISIGPLLGFKGGTACYFFYNLPRFSVDLDFDLLETKKEKVVYRNIENIIKNHGIIKDQANKKYTLYFMLSYEHGSINIKIEINKRSFGSHYELKDYLGIPMLVMKKGDMFANKLVSMTERKQLANRDLYDAWYFLKENWDISPDIIKRRKNMSMKSYLNHCVSFIEKVAEKHLLSGIGELLDAKGKNCIKKNLKKELLMLLKIRLDSLN